MWYYCRVTRMLVSYDLFRLKLTLLSFNCRVTRMLVSYDIVTHPVVAFVILQGHQNVGELRLKRLKVLYFAVELQGHQNVGELRLVLFAVYEQFSVLQGHQNVGELRHLNCCSVSYCNCFAFKM